MVADRNVEELGQESKPPAQRRAVFLVLCLLDLLLSLHTHHLPSSLQSHSEVLFFFFSFPKDPILFYLFLNRLTTWPVESLPQPGIEPTPLALEVQSLNHTMTRDIPEVLVFLILFL